MNCQIDTPHVLRGAAGCDQGYHTYCVNRRTIPLGDWFCPTCVQERRLREQQRQARRARRREEQQQRLEQQAATQAAAAARASRGRLRRRSNSAAAAADSDADYSIDLTLLDSEAESEQEGTAGVRRSRRGVRGRVSDEDSDYEDDDLHSEELHDDSGDRQDSDWEVEQAHGTRRSSRGTGRRSAAAASNGTSRGGARQVDGSSSHGSSGSTRLKSWHELREEEERTASAHVTRPAAGTARNQTAAASAGASNADNMSASRRIVDLLRSVNQERRDRQNQAAPATAQSAGSGRSRPLHPDDEAWTTLDQLRAARTGSAAAAGSRGGSSHGSRKAGRGLPAANSANTTPQSAQAVGLGGSRNGTVVSGYFSDGPHHHRQRQSNQSIANNSQEDRLRQALLARLQKQKQEQQQRSVGGAADLGDPRDPGYLDMIRDDITAARNKGEEDRRKRTLADSAAAAASRSGGRAASRGGGAAQPVSRLARSISAAQRKEVREQQQQQRWRDNSSDFMTRWLDTGVSSHDERRAAAGSNHRQQQQHELPRAVRTLGAVRRGAAMQAAAAAAAGGGSSARLAGAAVNRAGQQAGRQPLQLLPSQPSQPQPGEAVAVPNAAKQLDGSRSRSRFFASHETAARTQACRQGQEMSWQHRLAASHVMANSSVPEQQQQHHRRQQQLPPVSLVPAGEVIQQLGGHQSLAELQEGLQRTDLAASCRDLHHGQRQQQPPGCSVLRRCVDGKFDQHHSAQGPNILTPHGQCSVRALHSSNSTVTAAPGTAADAQCSTGTWAPERLITGAQQQQQQGWPTVDLGPLGYEATPWTPQVQPIEQRQQQVHHIYLHQHVQTAADPHCVLQQQVSAVEPAALSYADLKTAKLAAHSLAKGRLGPLFAGGKITKELYSRALKAATHELYEKVKQGSVGLEALTAAAEATSEAVGSTVRGGAEVAVMLDSVLEHAGVFCLGTV